MERIDLTYKQIPGSDIEPGWYAYWAHRDGRACQMPNSIAGPFRYKREDAKAARNSDPNSRVSGRSGKRS